MKCRDARELINSYIDNGLDPKLDSHLMEHVKNCPKCSRELALLIEYKDTLKKIKTVKAPDNFMAELHKRLEAERSGAARRFLNDTIAAWRRFSFPYEAAGVIAVALLIFFLYTPFFHREKAVETFKEEQISLQKPEKGKAAVTQKKEILREEKPAGKSKPLPSILSDKLPAKNLFDSDIKNKAADEDRATVEEKKESFYEAEKSPAGAYSNGSPDSERKFRSSAKSKGMPEFSKKAENEPVYRTPEIIFAESGASIIKREVKDNSRVLYLVEVKESAINTLTENLKKDFIVSSKFISRKEDIAVVEFTISKKSE